MKKRFQYLGTAADGPAASATERGGVAATSRSTDKRHVDLDFILRVTTGAAAAADPARRGTQPRSGGKR